MDSADAARTDAASSIAEAARLTSRAHRSSRWYALYLVIFGAVSFVVAVLFSFVHGALGALVLSGVWVVFVLALTLWQSRQKTAMVGMGRLHGWVMGLWTGAWIITLFVGLYVFPNRLAWWAVGGLLMALPPLVGASIANRRTRA